MSDLTRSTLVELYAVRRYLGLDVLKETGLRMPVEVYFKDPRVAERVRKAVGRRRTIVEKKMFGGVGFLHRGNMCVGIWQDFLIVRVGPDQAVYFSDDYGGRVFKIGYKSP